MNKHPVVLLTDPLNSRKLFLGKNNEIISGSGRRSTVLHLFAKKDSSADRFLMGTVKGSICGPCTKRTKLTKNEHGTETTISGDGDHG